MKSESAEVRLSKEFDGFVISDKMQKTIVVEVSRRVAHPEYSKVITLKTKFYAHDEKEEASVGDVVTIRESRPLSKTKRWTLIKVVRKGEEGARPIERTRMRKANTEKASAQGGRG